VNNIAQVRGADVIGSLVIVTAATVLAWGAIYLLIRHQIKSALVISVFLILFFAYGHIQGSVDYLLNTLRLGISIGDRQENQAILLIISVIILISAAFLTFKSGSDLSKVTGFLNVFSLAVVLIIGAKWCYAYFNAPNDAIQQYILAWENGRLEDLPELGSPQKKTDLAGKPLPDIYYIILDGYGRSDILKSMYSFDNSDFLDKIKERGFYIAEESTPNYNFTWLSLSSSLNFMYLDGVANQIGTRTRYTLPLEVMIEDNRLFRILRSYGYKIVTFASEDPVVDLTSADVYLNFSSSGLNAFQNELYNTTPLPTLLNVLSLKDQYDLHRERVRYMLDHLPEVRSGIEGPLFVFAHILAPHPPFVFDENGDPVQPDYPFSWADASNYMAVSARDSYITGYQKQAQFISKRMQATIDQILSNSPRSPIIIIQGDHGPGAMFDLGSLENSNLNERMSILNAYYFPDQDYKDIYPGITPVNSFRVVLNRFLAANFELLADRNYFVTLDRPYNFIDVTDALHKR
jgi:hypothetical protein